MGCVSSKKIRCDSPPYEDVRSISCIGSKRPKQEELDEAAAAVVVKAEAEEESERKKRRDREDTSSELKKHVHRRQSQGELVAAGWPVWLTAVASEAIDGWVPLRADAYERLDKVYHYNKKKNG